MSHNTPRSSWQVTRSVWGALFLREAMARITATRFAWFWMFLEPLAHVVVLVMVRELMGRMRFITNADYIPWLIVGITVFILFRYGVTRSIGAIESNRGLFAYRQVKPIDTVLVRAILEGLLQSLVFIILLVVAVMLGFDLLPFDPLRAIFVWLSMWLLGLGVGLLVSVGSVLVEEVGRVVKIMMLPMYFFSGIMFPLQILPHDVQFYVLLNPVVHGVESLRLSFFEGYQTLGGINLMYLNFWVLCCVALGLILHIHFAARLRAQ